MSRKRVYAIENNYEEVGYFIETVLTLEGYEVKAFDDSRAGAAALRASPPDLLVLDLVMPGVTGWEILAMVRSDPAFTGMAVIVLTAAADSEVEERACAQGAGAVLVKPISARQLVRAVEQEVGKP
ncbi:MAG: response regulator [Anaerolineae bacterium]|nr:response regulator [Anaerolineae bacterium]